MGNSPLKWHDEPTDPAQIKDEPWDPGCGRYASQMTGLGYFTEEGQSNADYIRKEEGTYNPETRHFLCDDCYIKAGMPTSPSGWKCP